MVPDSVFLACSLLLEALLVVRLLLATLRHWRKRCPGLDCRESLRTAKRWIARWWHSLLHILEPKHETQRERHAGQELDAMLCRLTVLAWRWPIAFGMARITTNQILIVMELPRTGPDLDAQSLLLVAAGVLISYKPKLVNPCSLDAWYVGATLLSALTITQASLVDLLRPFTVSSFSGKVVLAVLARRTWCFCLCSVVDMGVLFVLALRQRGLSEHLGEQDLAVLGPIVSFAVWIWIGTIIGRYLVRSYASLHMRLRTTTVEMDAVSSLLCPCFDAVLTVDEGLRLAKDSQQLSAMLLITRRESGPGLETRSLLDFFCSEDRARVKQQFEATCCSGSSAAMALNADMLDVDQNRVKVQVFHVHFRNLAGEPSFLVGVRELNERDEAVPAPLRLTRLAKPVARAPSGISRP